MTTKEVLLKAAEYLKLRGWQKNSYGNDGGPRCVVGALFSASPHYEEREAAARRLKDFIGGYSVIFWNDRIAKDADEVSRRSRPRRRPHETGSPKVSDGKSRDPGPWLDPKDVPEQPRSLPGRSLREGSRFSVHIRDRRRNSPEIHLLEKLCQGWPVHRWNDYRLRTKGEVLAKLDEAIIIAEKEGKV